MWCPIAYCMTRIICNIILLNSLRYFTDDSDDDFMGRGFFPLSVSDIRVCVGTL